MKPSEVSNAFNIDCVIENVVENLYGIVGEAADSNPDYTTDDEKALEAALRSVLECWLQGKIKCWEAVDVKHIDEMVGP